MKDKKIEYYAGYRRDIIKIIPKEVKNILSIGCGAGITERHLEKKDIEVVGIELNENIAKKARRNIKKVFTGDIGKINLPFREYFDCILYADSLEHLINPKSNLMSTKKYLKNRGHLIISFPNVRFWYTFHMLLFKKDWIYQERGIFDSTHLRFFTLKSMRRLLNEVGYDVLNVRRNYRLFEFPTKYNIFAKFIAIFPFRDILTHQFIIVAKKRK